MAKNIHFNEFKLEYKENFYQFNSKGIYKKRLPNYDKESVWKFVRNGLSFRENTTIRSAWLFYITEKGKVLGYSRFYGVFRRSEGPEVLRNIMMAGVTNVVMVMEFDLKDYKSEDFYPSLITRFYTEKFSYAEITIQDALVVSDITYYSLKENSLI